MNDNQVFSFYQVLGLDAKAAASRFALFFPERFDFLELDEETRADFIAGNPANEALLIGMALGYRFSKMSRPILLSTQRSTDFAAFLQGQIGDSKQEQLLLALVNSRLDLIGFEVVFVGTLTEVSASPREIFQRALKANAYAMMIAHNHPSGRPNPSQQDRRFSQQLYQLGQALRLPLLDSFIVTKDQYWSFQEHGQFGC
ncbi:JAB domain-containing protein [Leuconostocaceae bacterium ESL0958]|nr:JAB domain-containing protein [Leuconostocaceae bacterium ESL0958]